MTDRRSPLEQLLSIIFHSNSQKTPFSLRQNTGLLRSYLWTALVSQKRCVTPSFYKVPNKNGLSLCDGYLGGAPSVVVPSQTHTRTHVRTHTHPVHGPGFPLGKRDSSRWSSREHKRLNCRVNHFPTQIAFRMQQSGLGRKITK